MKTTAAALVTLCLLAIAAAGNAAGCSPISCSPSQVPLAHGRLLVVRPSGVWGPVRVVDLRTGATRWRLPSGQLAGNLLVHKDNELLTWFNVATGERIGDAEAKVRGGFGLVGASQDGARAVLQRTHKGTTTFAIVSPKRERVVALQGSRWGFDALSGDKLYLLQYFRQGYEVRVYDLAADRLDPAPLKDQEEEALIGGTPWVRLSSSDGRYLFTLYLTSAGTAMVHELDVRTATARCVDLPESRDFNTASSYTLTLSADNRTLWAVSPGDGKVAAVDVADARVRDSFDFEPLIPNSPTGGSAAISPDGERLAVSLVGRLWVVTFARHRVVKQKPHRAIALGFSTNGRVLWLVDGRSRATAVKLAA